MNEQILIVDEVILVRWRAMTSAGVARVLAAVDELAARGVVPVFIGLVGDGVSPPVGEANAVLMASFDTARSRCSSVNLVLDGVTMTSAAIRGGATAMFLLKGDRRTKMYTSLKEALLDRVRDRCDAILAAAIDAGVLSSPAPLRRSA